MDDGGNVVANAQVCTEVEFVAGSVRPACGGFPAVARGRRDGKAAMRKFQGLRDVDSASQRNDQAGDQQTKSEHDKKGDLFQRIFLYYICINPHSAAIIRSYGLFCNAPSGKSAKDDASLIPVFDKTRKSFCLISSLRGFRSI